MALVPKRARLVERFHGLITSAGGGDTPLSRNEHPRFLITLDNLATIKANLGTGGIWYSAFVDAVAFADSNFATVLGSASDTDKLTWPLLYALISVTHPVTGINYVSNRTAADYGNLAKDLVNDNVNGPFTNPSSSSNQNFGYHSIIAADWCWSYFTTAQLNALRAWYIAEPGPPTTHPMNSQWWRTRALGIIPGYIYQGGESFGLESGTNAWALANGEGDSIGGFQFWMLGQRGAFRAESEMVRLDGGYSEADGYFPYGWHYSSILAEARRRMLAQTKATYYTSTDYDFVKGIPYYQAHQMRPYGPTSGSHPGGHKYRYWMGHYTDPTTHSSVLMGGSGSTELYWYNMYLTAGQLTGVDTNRAALARWLVGNRVTDGTISFYVQGSYGHIYMPILFTVIDEAVATAQSPDALGLARNRVRRDALIEFRTSWPTNADVDADINATMLKIMSGKFLRSEQSDRSPGTFSIDRKGPAVNGWGGGGGGQGPFKGWPIAGNVLAAVDRTVTTNPTSTHEEGSIRCSGGEWTGSDSFYETDGETPKNGTLFDQRDTRTVRFSTVSGQKIHYIYLDHDKAYGSNISYTTREFAYCEPVTEAISPAVLFVRDRMTTTNGTTFEQRNQIYTTTKPTVTAGGSAAGPSRQGNGAGAWLGTDGKTTYTTPTSVRWDNNVNVNSAEFDNTTYLTPIAPAVNVVTVGGPSGTRTAQATGNDATHIKFASNASSTSITSGVSYVELVGGTGSGQSYRYITSYDGGTKIATVTPAWTTTPDGTSQYVVHYAASGSYAGSLYQDPANPSHEIEGAYGDIGGLVGNKTYQFGGGSAAPTNAEEETYSSWGRVELIPTVDATTNEWLYAIEVVPYNTAKSTTTALTGLTNCIGATVGTSGFVSGTGSSPVVSLAFGLAATGTYRILVSRLTASTAFTVRRKTGTNITSIAGIDPTVSSGTSISVTSTSEGVMVIDVVVNVGGSGDENIVEIL